MQCANETDKEGRGEADAESICIASSLCGERMVSRRKDTMSASGMSVTVFSANSVESYDDVSD